MKQELFTVIRQTIRERHNFPARNKPWEIRPAATEPGRSSSANESKWINHFSLVAGVIFYSKKKYLSRWAGGTCVPWNPMLNPSLLQMMPFFLLESKRQKCKKEKKKWKLFATENLQGWRESFQGLRRAFLISLIRRMEDSHDPWDLPGRQVPKAQAQTLCHQTTRFCWRFSAQKKICLWKEDAAKFSFALFSDPEGCV